MTRAVVVLIAVLVSACNPAPPQTSRPARKLPARTGEVRPIPVYPEPPQPPVHQASARSQACGRAAATDTRAPYVRTVTRRPDAARHHPDARTPRRPQTDAADVPAATGDPASAADPAIRPDAGEGPTNRVALNSPSPAGPASQERSLHSAYAWPSSLVRSRYADSRTDRRQLRNLAEGPSTADATVASFAIRGVEVVTAHGIALRRRGRTHFGPCPFVSMGVICSRAERATDALHGAQEREGPCGVRVGRSAPSMRCQPHGARCARASNPRVKSCVNTRQSQ